MDKVVKNDVPAFSTDEAGFARWIITQHDEFDWYELQNRWAVYRYWDDLQRFHTARRHLFECKPIYLRILQKIQESDGLRHGRVIVDETL